MLFFFFGNRALWAHETGKKLIEKVGPLYKTKFMKAWRKLPHETTKSGGASKPVAYPTRVVVSEKEQESMSKMETAITEIGDLLKQNKLNQSTASEETTRLSAEIEQTFATLVAKLTERAMALQQKLKTESKKRTDALSKEEEALKQLLEAVQKGLNAQNALILDPKFDGTVLCKKCTHFLLMNLRYNERECIH